MVESVQQENQSTTATETPVEPTKEPYSGDKGLLEHTFVRDVPVEPTVVPLFTYGRRVRIAALHQSYEQYLDHLIEVGGWARTTRKQGRELFFIELTDGSCSGTLQVVVTKDMPEFDDIAKSLVGASYKFKGKLIRSPKEGQPFEL